MEDPSDGALAVPDNYIVLDFADGEYEFRLTVGGIAELQTKCGAGVGRIFARLHADRFQERGTPGRPGDIVLNPLQAEFQLEDIHETIRLGLIGGGRGIVAGQEVAVSPAKALQLMRDYVHPRPLLENWKVASCVLSAFLIGYTDPDKAQKKSPTMTPETATAGST